MKQGCVGHPLERHGIIHVGGDRRVTREGVGPQSAGLRSTIALCADARGVDHRAGAVDPVRITRSLAKRALDPLAGVGRVPIRGTVANRCSGKS